jgi:hypothetical protein
MPDIGTTQNSQICVRSSDGDNNDLARPYQADIAARRFIACSRSVPGRDPGGSAAGDLAGALLAQRAQVDGSPPTDIPRPRNRDEPRMAEDALT